MTRRKDLMMCGSEEVARAITQIADGMSDDELRQTLLDEWTRCEAHQPYRAEFVGYFGRAGFVSDTETLPARLRGRTCTIYRGNQGEDEPVGIAWTLDRKKAEWFAMHAQSIRGQFLGLHDPDGIPSVWAATVDTAAVLGYFNDRGEREVVVDPATLRNVWMVAQAVAA